MHMYSSKDRAVKIEKKECKQFNLLSHFENSKTFRNKRWCLFFFQPQLQYKVSIHEVIPKSSFRSFPSHFYQNYHKCNVYTDSNTS